MADGHVGAASVDLHVAIVHASPGRIRLKVPREAIGGEALARAERALQDQKGMREVRRSPVTCSVLVRFDPDAADLPTILSAVQDAGLNLILETADPGASSTPGEPANLGDSISAFFRDADGRVARITRGRADLRTLVPMGLGALAVRELLAGRAIAAPWYVLAWYAFDSFTKLRESPRTTDSARS